MAVCRFLFLEMLRQERLQLLKGMKFSLISLIHLTIRHRWSITQWCNHLALVYFLCQICPQLLFGASQNYCRSWLPLETASDQWHCSASTALGYRRPGSVRGHCASVLQRCAWGFVSIWRYSAGNIQYSSEGKIHELSRCSTPLYIRLNGLFDFNVDSLMYASRELCLSSSISKYLWLIPTPSLFVVEKRNWTESVAVEWGAPPCGVVG